MNQYRPQAILKSILLFSLLLSGIAFGKPWKSAEMITQQSFKYGAFEARIRGAEGSGMITAFFLYKNGSEWAGAEWQEQDFELFGKNGGFQTQVMTPGDPRTENVTNHRAATDIWDRYFTYRMEWTPTALSFYVDGKLVRRETDPVVYSKLLDPARAEPMNLRISLWAGDFEWSGAFDEAMVPASVDVNWAQVSSYTPGAGPDGSDFTPLWKDDFNSINYSRWYFANWTFEYAVNDYTPGGARVDNGYLQLKLTHWSEEGRQFTPSPIDDGQLMPPTDETDPTDPVDPTDPTDPVVVPGEPVPLPGTILATRPSRYFDVTPGNHGDPACFDGDLDSDRGPDGICYAAGAKIGEWIEYDVVTSQAGDWDLSAKLATDVDGRLFRIEVDGQPLTGPILVPRAGWQQFTTIALPSVTLSAGIHAVRIVFLTDDMNFHSMEFVGNGTVVPPPGVVTGVTAVPGISSISLSWTATAGATGYDIQRGPVGGPYVTIQTVASTSWIDQPLLAGATFSYVIVAKNAAGSALPSASVSAIPLAPVPADQPSALSAVASTSRVELAWTAGANNTSFRVYRSLDGASFTLLASPATPSYIDLAVVNGTGYTYRVTGMFDGRESAPTSNATATPVGVAPARVAGVVATPGDQQIALSWPASTGATSYKVFRSVSGGVSTLAATVATASLIDAGLINGTAYSYVVVASNVWGDASGSTAVSATPTLPTASIKAQYKAGTTGSTNGIRPLLRLLNTGAVSIPLSELTVRYWYTNEGSKPQNYWCDWAQLGNSNVVASFVTVSPARTGADTYLQLGFRPAAGSLAAGGNSGEIQSRFSKSDWSNYNQANDASYNPLLTSTFGDWNNVTVYRNGTLIWGVEP